MAYSFVNETSIFFGNPDENLLSSDKHIINNSDIGTWQRFRIAFWFVGKSSRNIYVKYPTEVDPIKLKHKLIDNKFHIYYHTKYDNDITVSYGSNPGEINIGTLLKLRDWEFFRDSDYVHILI